MREITSQDNKIYKHALSLLKKKYRDESGEYLIEGSNLITEAIKCGAELKTIFISQDFDISSHQAGDIVSKNHGICFLLPRKLFMGLCETETPQGIVAITAKHREFRFSGAAKSGGNFVVIDRLQDPGNIGTIIRTADAAGFELAIFMKGSADPYQPKVVRAAAGSLFRVPLKFIDNVGELKEFVHERGKRLIAADMDAEHEYYECDLRENVAIIIGNEGNGISDELIEASDKKIRIPMCSSIESLNASVAAGILMYERIRK